MIFKGYLMKNETRMFIIKGKPLKYCFVCRKGGGRYGIMIEYGNERSLNCLGKNFSEAARLYDALTKGLVTPTTVKYILEDTFSSKIVK